MSRLRPQPGPGHPGIRVPDFSSPQPPRPYRTALQPRQAENISPPWPLSPAPRPASAPTYARLLATECDFTRRPARRPVEPPRRRTTRGRHGRRGPTRRPRPTLRPGHWDRPPRRRGRPVADQQCRGRRLRRARKRRSLRSRPRAHPQRPGIRPVRARRPPRHAGRRRRHHHRRRLPAGIQRRTSRPADASAHPVRRRERPPPWLSSWPSPTRSRRAIRAQVVRPGVVATEFNGGFADSVPFAMTAESVARASLAGLRLGETICIPGLECQTEALDTLLATETSVLSGGNHHAHPGATTLRRRSGRRVGAARDAAVRRSRPEGGRHPRRRSVRHRAPRGHGGGRPR